MDNEKNEKLLDNIEININILNIENSLNNITIPRLKFIIRECVNNYITQNKLDKIQLIIDIEDNIYEKLLSLTYDEEEKQNLIKSKLFIENLNGTISLPNNIDGEYHILLSKSIVSREKLVFIKTLVHELVHIYDYKKFLSHKNKKSYNGIKKLDNHFEFFYWTEFRAYRTGYQYYINMVLSDLENQNDIIKEEINHLCYHFESLQKVLKNSSDNIYKSMYYMVSYLGIYSVWMDLKIFNLSSDNLKTIYKGNMDKLYSFFVNNENLNDMDNNINKLSIIIEDIVKDSKSHLTPNLLKTQFVKTLNKFSKNINLDNIIRPQIQFNEQIITFI